MANPFLIIVTVILSVAIIVGSFYILVYFQHPEDKNTAWFPKVVVVTGLTLACFSVLMLPLDVANGSNGGFPMATLLLVVYITMAVMAVVVVPFAMFYYEGDEYDETGEAPSQLSYALKGTIITVIVFAVVTAVLYITIGIAEIPVVQLQATFVTTVNRTVPNDKNGYIETPYSCPFVNVTFNASIPTNVTVNDTVVLQYVNRTEWALENNTCYYYNTTLDPLDKDLPYYIARQNTIIQFRVTIALFIITIVVFFGWLLFIIFGGIGMVALPWDCINAWRNRPVRIPLDKYLVRKKDIGDQATKLIEKGKAIQEKQRKGRESKRDRRNYNKFRQAVFILEEDYERLQLCYKRQGGKIILYFLTLIFGIIGVGVTICWLLQIILYVFTQPYPIDPFLNTAFIKLDDAFGLLGTVMYGLFAFYLLLCVIKGNFKFGMRFFFLFPIHPMRVGGTLMNAFLFNVGLILICAFSVTQFCTSAFSDYDTGTNGTAVNSLFALSIQNMMGIKYVFIAYVYAFFIMVFLTAIYFAIKPKDRPAANDIY